MTLLYGPKLIGAIIVWVIGGWVIKAIGRGAQSALTRGGTDPSLMPFLTSLVPVFLLKLGLNTGEAGDKADISLELLSSAPVNVELVGFLSCC